MLGSYHVAVADKARGLGMEVNVPMTHDQIENEGDPIFTAFYSMTHDATISYDALKKAAAAEARR